MNSKFLAVVSTALLTIGCAAQEVKTAHEDCGAPTYSATWACWDGKLTNDTSFGMKVRAIGEDLRRDVAGGAMADEDALRFWNLHVVPTMMAYAELEDAEMGAAIGAGIQGFADGYNRGYNQSRPVYCNSYQVGTMVNTSCY